MTPSLTSRWFNFLNRAISVLAVTSALNDATVNLV